MHIFKDRVKHPYEVKKNFYCWKQLILHLKYKFPIIIFLLKHQGIVNKLHSLINIVLMVSL